MTYDLATKVVVDHHETFEWCEAISRDNEYSVYRPNDGLLQSRNHYLHEVMHHRSYQPEY